MPSRTAVVIGALLPILGLGHSHTHTVSSTIHRKLQAHVEDTEAFISSHRVLSKLHDFDLVDFSAHAGRQLNTLTEHLDFDFESFGNLYSVPLEKHQVTAHNTLPHFAYNGDGDFTLEHVPVDCFYRLRTDESTEFSHALFSFCNGEVRGWVQPQNDNKLHLQPIELPEAEGRASRKLVATYREEHIHDSSWSCGNSHEDEMLYSHSYEHIPSASLRVPSSKMQESSFVEVLIVNDKPRTDFYTVGTFQHSLFIFESVNQLYQGFLGENKITLRVTGVVSFFVGDPWDSDLVFDNSGRVIVDRNEGLLNLFKSWVVDVRTSLAGATGSVLSYDTTHLLSGYDFSTVEGNAGVVGLAGVGSVCAQDASGTTEDQFIDAQTTTVMAHEIGHNLGFSHTNEIATNGIGPSASCQSNNIPRIMDSSGTTATSWSTCSRDWWLNTLNNKGASACFNNEAAAPLNSPNCGNGQVDEGEECDCGLLDCNTVVNGQPVDACCDGQTCQYNSGATCAANDLCCNLGTCSVEGTSGRVCREAKDDSNCDVEEVCDGLDKSCPDDSQAIFGSSCSVNSFNDGRCFRGSCVSPANQCSIESGSSHCGPQGTRDEFCSGQQSFGLTCGACATSFQIIIPAEGTECDDDSGCFQGQCVPYEDIPVVDQCLNFVLDEGETDVDCGGDVCLPCVAGKRCSGDEDCFGFCNSTVGICVGVSGGSLVDIYDLLVAWVADNPVIAALIFGSAGLGCVYTMASSAYANYKADKAQRAHQQSLSTSRNASTSRLGVSNPLHSSQRHLSVNRNSNRASQRASQRASERASQRASNRASQRMSRRNQIREIQETISEAPFAVVVPAEVDLAAGNRSSQRSIHQSVVSGGLDAGNRASQRSVHPSLVSGAGRAGSLVQVSVNPELIAAEDEAGTPPVRPKYYSGDIEDNL